MFRELIKLFKKKSSESLVRSDDSENAGRIDPSVPRKRRWLNEARSKEVCPECGNRLINDYQAFYMAIRQGGRVSSSITGNKGGFFCVGCPVVVLDHKEFAQAAKIASGNMSFVEFAVVGLVDYGAVPTGKRELPIGTEENPIALVQFTNIKTKSPGASRDERSSSASRHRAKKKKKQR